MADSEDGRDDRDYVNSLARGLDVIRAFGAGTTSMTLSEVAAITSMNRAAARRFLLTLAREGYAGTNGKLFWLRPKVLELGYAALSSLSLPLVAQPHLDELTAEIRETCYLVVLDGYDTVYLAHARSDRLFDVGLNVGGRLPAFCMSSGRVILAGFEDDDLDRWLEDLDDTPAYTQYTLRSKQKLRVEIMRTRRQGWSLVDQEYELGLRSLSAPVVDATGQTLAALNVTCPTPRVELEEIKNRFLPAVLHTARALSDLVPEGLTGHENEWTRVGRSSGGRAQARRGSAAAEPSA
jgi:IclR family transcriptional regulator, pca regulon regulatory protein